MFADDILEVSFVLFDYMLSPSPDVGDVLVSHSAIGSVISK